MANVNNPHGLTYLGFCLGGGPGTVEPFNKVVGYGVAIFPGDAVNQVADGSIEVSATPGSTLYSGVALNYGALSAATEHIVITSADAIFEAQGDNAGGSDTLLAVDEGFNANLLLSTAGVVLTLKSGHQIDASVKNTNVEYDVKLRRLYNVPENAYGAYARFEIQFNKHRNAPGVVGV